MSSRVYVSLSVAIKFRVYFLLGSMKQNRSNSNSLLCKSNELVVVA